MMDRHRLQRLADRKVERGEAKKQNRLRHVPSVAMNHFYLILDGL